MIWDEGFWHPTVDADKGLRDGSLKFTLGGSRLKGNWALVRMKPKLGEKNNNWLLIKEKDEYENAYDIGQFTTSIRTGRTMSEIEDGKNKSSNSRADTKKRPKAVKNDPKKQPSKERIAKNVAISNPDKILYKHSGITKGDVVQYYLRVSERMMPYIEDRILSTVRCPEGIDSACFYKKHPTYDKGISKISLTEGDGKTEDYYYAPDAYGLISEVQMNTIEFHTWGSRIDTLEKPDIMVFDLDPDAGMDIGKVRQGARDLKSLLDKLSLVSFLKTSGGKGYHIVIPFKPSTDWDAFHGFSKNIAKAMESTWPENYTSNSRKEHRNNRIFIDWMRNGRGATSVAPYSLRARDGAPVSMPISWNELDTVAPKDITMYDALKRLDSDDPWEGFFSTGQQLE